MNILITGGAGFIGSHLSTRLVLEGYNVVCIDNFYTGDLQNIKHLMNNRCFTLVREDVAMMNTSYKMDQIYNLACPASPKHYKRDPIYTLKTSIYGTLQVLETAKKSSARILQASTSEVYGDPLEHPQGEEYWGNVNSIGERACYDEGKRVAETFFSDYHRLYGIDTRIARIFNTYGPRMAEDDGRVVSNFIVKALNNEPLEIYGDGSQTRSFCYIDDLVEGLIRLMACNEPVGPVNLGNSEEHTIIELAELIIALTKSKSKLEFKPLPENDPVRRKPNLHKANRLLGWKPEVNIEQGLLKTIEYYKALGRKSSSF